MSKTNFYKVVSTYELGPHESKTATLDIYDLHNLVKFLHLGTHIAIGVVPQEAELYREKEKYQTSLFLVSKIILIEEFAHWDDLDYCYTVLNIDPYCLKYVKNPTKELILHALHREGCALQFVKNKTLDLCKAAVKQNGLALYFVEQKEPSELLTEIYQTAIKQTALALRYVKFQTDDLRFLAVKKMCYVVQYCTQVNDKLIEIVRKQDPYCLKYFKHLA